MASRTVFLLALVLMPAAARAEPVANGLPLSAWLGRLRHGDASERQAAAAPLGVLGPKTPGVAEALGRALDDPDCRDAAAAALAGWGDEGVRLLAPALGDVDTLTRRTAARALATMQPSPDAAAALRKALRDRDVQVRFHAAVALIRAAPDQAKEALTVLSRELKPGVYDEWAELALPALTDLGPRGRAAGPALRQLLQKPDLPERLVSQCIHALSRVCRDHPGEAVDALEPLLYRPALSTRFSAAVALVELGVRDDAVLATLTHRLRFSSTMLPQSDEWLCPQERRIEALVRLGSPAAGALARALDDPDTDVSAGAARALASFDPLPAAVRPSLERALKSPDKDTKRWAALALLRTAAAPSVRPMLVELLAEWGGWRSLGPGGGKFHRFEWHAEVARRVDRAWVPDLIVGLESGSDEVKVGCAAALAGLGRDGHEATPALRACLASESFTVRSAAAVALGEVGEEVTDVVPLLLDTAATATTTRLMALADVQRGREPPGWMQRADRARTLLVKNGAAICSHVSGALKSDRGGTSLLGLLADAARDCDPLLAKLSESLADRDAAVRLRAVRVVGLVGDRARAAAPGLRALLEDESSEIRLRAAAALWEVTGDARPGLPVLMAGFPERPDVATEALERMGPAAQEALPLLADKLLRVSPAASFEPSSAEPLFRVAPDAAAALAAALSSREDQVRDCASEWLLRLGPSAAPALVGALRAPEADARAAAAKVLGELKGGDAAARPALLAALNDSEPRVAVAAARALYAGRGGGRAALPLLREALVAPEAPVRAEAAEVLGLLGADAGEAVPQLRRALHDGDRTVRANAARALGNLGAAAKDAALDLRNCWRQEPDPDVQKAVVVGLGRLAGAGVEPREAVQVLALALRSPHPSVRGVAAVALDRIPDGAILPVPALLDSLDGGDGIDVGNVRESLARVARAGRLPQLMAGLSHPSPTVRAEVAFVIADCPERASPAIPVLVALLDDADARVRRGATLGLRNIGPAAKPAAGRLGRVTAEDPEPAVRRFAVEALGRIGPDVPDVLPALAGALQDPERDVRVAAVSCLGDMKGNEDALRLLAGAAADPRPPERQYAAMALVQHGRSAVRPFLELLLHPNAAVRADAAAALGELGDEARDAGGPLRAALADGDDAVRAAAARALGRLGPGAPGRAPGLLRLLGDDACADVRYAAALGLGDARVRAARAALREAVLHDGEERVRCAAGQALLLIDAPEGTHPGP